jgi:hypothetical protein
MPLALEEVLAGTGGELRGALPAGTSFRRIERDARRVDHDQGERRLGPLGPGPADERRRRAPRRRVGHKIVAVEPLAANRDEEVPGRGAARVPLDAAEPRSRRQGAAKFAAGARQHLLQRERRHGRPPPSVR